MSPGAGTTGWWLAAGSSRPAARQVCAAAAEVDAVSARMLGDRIADALRAACHPGDGRASAAVVPRAVWRSAGADSSGGVGLVPMAGEVRPGVVPAGRIRTAVGSVDALVTELFIAEGSALVRLARIFVDDRNAAEDLVQEAFIRLARNTHRIKDRTKAPAYLRSIVLNLARDHNRRGLVSLRHHLPFDDARAATEDELDLSEDRQRVLDALRELPLRQRSCLVLRYYEELGVEEIGEVLGISRNTVKTHLRRGLAAMEARL